jgi:hypothetical protein
MAGRVPATPRCPPVIILDFSLVLQAELRRLRAALHEVSARHELLAALSLLHLKSYSHQRLTAAAADHDALQREALEGGTTTRSSGKTKRKTPSAK